MKYIVFWTALYLTSIQCPDHIGGCAVNHMKMEYLKDSASYESRSEAFKQYSLLISSREAGCYMIYGNTLPFPDYFKAPYSDIRIDSVPNTFYYVGGRHGKKFTDSTMARRYSDSLTARNTHDSIFGTIYKNGSEVDKKKLEEWLEVDGQQSGGINTISNVRGTTLIAEDNVLIAPTRNGGRLKIKMNLPDSSLTITGDTTGIVNTLYDFIVKQNTRVH